MLALGCFLIILGVAAYFTIGGSTRLLILIVVGIAFLIASVVYPNREKQIAAA